MKKILFIILGFFLMVIGGAGVAYAANPEATESALRRVTSVFVTNWPANQSVTVTNPVTINKPQRMTKTLGSKGVAVTWTDRVPIPDLPQMVEYASYQGKGELKYLTAVGVKGLGVQIWTDGELVAASDGRDLEAYFGLNTTNGWRLAKMDEAYSSFEVREEYPFNNEIKILLYKSLTDQGTGGAHIELEVEK